MPSFKLQFNFIFISDIMFDKITKLPEEDQISEMAAVVGLNCSIVVEGIDELVVKCS